MAERKPMFLGTNGLEEVATTDSIQLGGVVMSGSGKITGLGAATENNDALAYGQSGANLSGLTIDTSALAMTSQKITGLGAATADNDALAYGQSSANLSGLTIDTAALAMSTQKITGLGAATADNDALAYGQDSANLQALTLDGGGLVISGSATVTGLPTPTADDEAASKGYVDAFVEGLDVKDSVFVATAAALPACTAGGSKVGKTLTADAVGILTVDDQATVLNNRILVKNQSTAADNGIYKVTTEGTAGVAFVLTRAIDADHEDRTNSGMFCFVEEGTANADNGFTLTTNVPITVDTTSLTFTQFSGAGQITAGVALTKTGNTIDFTPNDLADTAIADGDYILFNDATDSNAPKREALAGLATLFAGDGLSAASSVIELDLNGLTAAVVDVAADGVALIDATDGSTKKETIADVVTAMAGDGLAATSGVLALDLNELTGAAVAVGTDSLPFIDSDGNVTRKESFADLATAMAGSGLTASSGVLALDLAGGVPEVVDISADEFLFIDATDAGTHKESFADLGTAMAGNGLAASSGALTLDLDDLAAAAVDVANDSIAIVDATDSSSKKEAIADLATAMAGDGLSATSGAFALDLNELTGAVVAVDADSIAIIDATDASTKKETVADLVSGVAGTGMVAESGQMFSETVVASSGFTVLPAGGVATNEVLAISATAGKVDKADANSDDLFKVVGICVAGAAQDAAVDMKGFGLAAGCLSTATTGAPQYLSETAGVITATQPTTSGAYVVRLGWAINATDLWFQPVYLGKKA